MSVVIEILKTFIKEAQTTKDLIYKNKSVDFFDIRGSYKKLVKEGIMGESIISYGDQKLYLTKEEGEVKNLFNLAYLHTALTNETLSKNENKINTMKIMENEIFNSLWIEGVRSSKRKIKQFLKEKDINLEEERVKYARNYKDALNFISTTNSISEENLYALYVILSRDIDLKENKLDGFPYRKEAVEIGDENHQGISPSLIKKSLDSIFDFIEMKEHQNNAFVCMINSILIHYLFELAHPYYDMNGRMGRLLTLWYANTKKLAPYFSNFSEAINLFKKEQYYKAYRKSEVNDFKFDATYFVQSVFFALVGQRLIETKIESINESIKDEYSLKLSDLQKDILMNIMSKDDRWYLAEDFILGISEINQGQVSKSISSLVKWGLIKETDTKPKEYKFIWSNEIKNSISDEIKDILGKYENTKLIKQ